MTDAQIIKFPVPASVLDNAITELEALLEGLIVDE